MVSKIFNNTKNKQTMKIKINKTIEEEVELSLPAYRKGVCHYYKIISDKLSIQVTALDNWSAISQVGTSVAIGTGKDECTEQEFNAKYEEISHILLRNVVDQYDEEEEVEDDEPDQDDFDEGDDYDHSEFTNRNVEASEGMER